MEKNKTYLILGFYFLFIQIIAILRNVIADYNNFFWFCDFVSLLLAIGFFLRKDDIIKSLINIGLFAQFLYLVGYFYKIFYGETFLDTIPLVTTLFYTISSILIHLSISIALIFTYKSKPTIKTLFSSLMFLFGMYIIALFFTTPEQGINYILSSRTLIPLTIPYYTELWVLLTFLIVVLPTQFIQYLIYKYFSIGEKQ
ncbi:MAG: hypothetical protein WC867_04250 [Candidatus Pacearchaeota archaeon]|jgi:hypothetical protein